MLRQRFAPRAVADLARIARFWADAEPSLFPDVYAALRAHINWVAAGNHWLGTRVPDVQPEIRISRERRFGYTIFYRVEGDRPSTIAVFAIRHGRQRPLAPASVVRYSRS